MSKSWHSLRQRPVQAAGRTFRNVDAWLDWKASSPIHDRIAAEIEAARVGAERQAMRAEVERLGIDWSVKP